MAAVYFKTVKKGQLKAGKVVCTNQKQKWGAFDN